MDRLTELPVNLINKILLSIPLRDAIRTCVLSKDWQYKWTEISKLILDYYFIDRITSNFDLVHIVNTILVQHTGILEEFHLYIPDLQPHLKDYINQSIRTVLRKGVKKLSIGGNCQFVWSSSFPDSADLTYLELNHSTFKKNSCLRGFQNVNTLIFRYVSCPFDTLSNIISNSPNLQRISLNLMSKDLPTTINAPKLEYLSLRGRFRSFYLWNLPNVKEMKIHVSSMSRYSPWEMTSLIRFFNTLAKLEKLTLGDKAYKLFKNAGQLKMLPRGFGELRSLKLTDVNFNNFRMMHTILCFIRSSPNLHRLQIIANPKPTHSEKLNLEDQSDGQFTLEHLQEVYIGPITGTENDLEVIKFLLLCSPSLQLMSITHAANLDEAVLSKVTNALMQFHLASTNVNINLCPSTKCFYCGTTTRMEVDSGIFGVQLLLAIS